MSASIVTQSAQIQCDHQAMGQSPSRISTRVKISEQSVVLVPGQYTVAGCPLVSPAGSPIPCATIMFSAGSTRVKVENSPVLLKSSTGMAIGPLPVQGQGRVTNAQTKVKAV